MFNSNDIATIFQKINLAYKKNMKGIYNKTNKYSKLISQKSIDITRNIQFLDEKAFNYILSLF